MRHLLLMAIVAIALIGCAGGSASAPVASSAADTACQAAFTAAANVDEMADTVSDLFPAVRACGSIEEWTAAFDAVAGAGFTGTATEVLANICFSAEVADAPLCTGSTTTGSDSPSTAASADGTFIEERGEGLTLTGGSSGAADLKGGTYRIAWLAEGCTFLDIEWAPADGDPISVTSAPPSGEVTVELPAGEGSLDRGADCDYTIRFEATE